MRHASRQDGFTLVEALVAMLVIGIGVVAVVGALQVAITSAAFQRGLEVGEVELRNAAEAIRAHAYQPCAEPEDYQGAAGAMSGESVDVEVAVVSYWAGPSNPETFVTTCDPADDPGAQLIVLEVSEAGNVPARQLEFVKRGGS